MRFTPRDLVTPNVARLCSCKVLTCPVSISMQIWLLPHTSRSCIMSIQTVTVNTLCGLFLVWKQATHLFLSTSTVSHSHASPNAFQMTRRCSQPLLAQGAQWWPLDRTQTVTRWPAAEATAARRAADKSDHWCHLSLSLSPRCLSCFLFTDTKEHISWNTETAPSLLWSDVPKCTFHIHRECRTISVSEDR